MRIIRIVAKTIVTFTLLASVRTALATHDGPYVGLQLGWGVLNQGEFIASNLNKELSKTFPDATVGNTTFCDTGRGGRAFIGYQFNRYLAAEIGYYRFSSLKLDASLSTDITVFQRFGLEIDVPLTLNTNIYVKTDAFDLVAKGMYPVTSKFSVYAKAGLVSLNSDGKAVITLQTSIADLSLFVDPSISIVYPVFGLGMSYDINDHVSADLSWTRMQKVNPCPYPSIDFAAVGLMYHFY